MFGLLDLEAGKNPSSILEVIAVALRDLSHDTQDSFVTNYPPGYK